MNDIVINYRIKSKQVKIVNHGDRPPYVLPLADAIALASKTREDVIQVAVDSKTDMAICEIMELGKYKYLKQKKQPVQNNTSLKEFKFGINIAEHDLMTKLNHALELMDKKHPVKIIVFLRNFQKGKMGQATELFNKISEILRKDADISEQTRKTNEKQIFGIFVKKSHGT